MRRTGRAKSMKIADIGNRPFLWIAFGFGAGFVPKAPGTAGTLAAIPLVFLIARLPLPLQFLVWISFFVLGCIVCQRAADWLNEQDPGAIVWDEVVGYCFAMALLPLSLQTVVITFVLFRLADIFKPWPISWVEKRVKGGLGIMLDDLLAGLLVNIVAHGLVFFQLIS